MGKAHRGKGLAKLPSKGRATCPVCKVMRVKCLYTLVLGNGKNVSVCKRCKDKKVENLEEGNVAV